MFSREEWDEAQRIGEQGAAIARELDDAPLLSAALDALSSYTLGTDPEAGLAFTREREALADRLPLYERVDTQNMVAWSSSALGDLTGVLEAATSILRDLAPNQAQALALSLAAWEVWALALLGRWDEVNHAAERASRLWDEAGRISSGFAAHGFIAAADVGRARRDDHLESRAVRTLLGITEQFPPGQLFRRLTAFAEPDPEALVRTVILDWTPYITRLHYVERAVALCADLRHPIPIDGLDNLLAEARTRGQRLLTAQTLRARGIQERDPDNLREALDMFRGFGARPLVARCRARARPADRTIRRWWPRAPPRSRRWATSRSSVGPPRRRGGARKTRRRQLVRFGPPIAPQEAAPDTKQNRDRPRRLPGPVW